jgi:myo-inositol-1(or 4)-monophosphatase
MNAIAVATEAAHKAGELILRHSRQAQDIHFKTPTEIVTAVDREAEDIIVRTIQQTFPDHQFLGEEGHTASQGADCVWVIDPLDGTRNYTLGIPFFSVSIALAVKGKTVLGVIYDPERGELFSAEAGKGTRLNGAKVHFARRTSMEQAVAYVGFVPAQNPDNPQLALPMLVRLRPAIAAVRNIGSAALSLAYVACGRLDIAYHEWLSAWDMLAGALLIEEAGGTATDFAGRPMSLASQNIIAANNPAFHAPVLRLARQVLADRQSRNR